MAVAADEPKAPALRIPRNRMKHDGPVLSVAYSTDGKRIASTSRDRTARVWRVPR